MVDIAYIGFAKYADIESRWRKTMSDVKRKPGPPRKAKEIQEIKNPVNCGHNDFRRVRVISSFGNKVYNQCKQCEYRELAE